jgi:tetratricopeptide (TPR) repeat protein
LVWGKPPDVVLNGVEATISYNWIRALPVVPMFSSSNFAMIRRKTAASLKQAQQSIAKGDYATAEAICKTTLDEWRRASGPKAEENPIISLLGKCYEAQRKYEKAYELYMAVLPDLKGAAYDEIYTSLLYLNERMGSFTKKSDESF